MKNYLLLTVIFVFSVLNSFSNESKVFFPGEKIVYEVSYIGITLGHITITSDSISYYNGEKVFNATSLMKSRDGIPFVDLHGYFYSWMSTNLSYSNKFVSNMKMDESDWLYQKSLMDYKKDKLEIELWRNKDLDSSMTLDIDTKINDGCSLFFLARQYTKSGKKLKIPTLVDTEIYPTIINFHNKVENVDIDAVDYDIETVYFDGQAQWEGIYGLSGKFKGWFSNDDASVPIKAKMKVYVGNVNIELVEWNRGNWQPPRAK